MLLRRKEEMLPIQLNTTCEGPLALNDNPFELCREFIKPYGDRFFRQVSRYNDYLADIAKKPGYRAGTALRLILPFLQAHGLTDDLLRDFSSRSLKLVPGAEPAYKFLHGFGFPIFEISAGYRQFAEAVGSRLGFDKERIFCTEANLDRYVPAPAEAEELRRLAEEIATAPALELPGGAGALAELPEPAQEAIARLDRIFGERLPQLEAGVSYREVNPLGGAEKAKAVSDSLSRTGLKIEDTIYVGDSNTDVQAFEALRAGGGLSISFNGDRDAVQAAEVIVVSDCAWPIALLAAICRLWSKEGVLEIAAPETRAKSRALVLPDEMIEPIVTGLQGHTFNLYMSNNPSLEKIIQESEAMRARLRGEAIASQG
jgi:predicted HAD superfamily phosphohydrolase